MFTVGGLHIMKTNLATCKAHKEADSLMVCSDFLTPLLCVRTMHDKPGSVSRVNRGQLEARLNPC